MYSSMPGKRESRVLGMWGKVIRRLSAPGEIKSKKS